ncbi:hypothetical protein LTR62_007842 [Meristemomyces frigidus]|uniref:Saccharopine dehydrogenase NADP binding domain-containing protein n=1 Tax=Meristemomyces frigidus TaxID=1508187 RepID=A0AAN7TLM8_9PEZI|nr:hypothetical protein LTR62_007842 [Meristemomyces frigidus]
MATQDVQSERQYEIIVFGATGYTGKYTCERITASLPTDLKWAVAGRSESKLQQIVDEIRSLNSNRVQPGVEVAQLRRDDLISLAKKTKVLISTVGPYHKYGTPVVEACVETGTHYVDCTGEVPWVYDLIQKYHSQAQKTGAIIIPQNGIESAPTDLICWSLVSHMRQTLGVGCREIVQTCYDMKATPSGGTFSTILTLFDSYSLSHLQKSGRPWSLNAIEGQKRAPSRPIVERLTGVRTVSDLGTLTDSLQGPADIPIVNRSWSLINGGEFYGPNFQLAVYTRTRNALTGLFIHVAMTIGFLAILLPPVRWVLQRLVTQPGFGPSKEDVKNEFVEWRAVAHADAADPNDRKRAFARMRWQGSMYALTGVCLSEAALTIARSKTLAHELGGGILTPATLGAPYLERLQKAGLQLEVRMMP